MKIAILYTIESTIQFSNFAPKEETPQKGLFRKMYDSLFA